MRAAAALAVIATGCSLGMQKHRESDPVPMCTDSALPVVADGAMTLAGGALIAGGVYGTHRCHDEGVLSDEGCSNGGAVALGTVIALAAGISTIVGAVRYSDCHAAYEDEESYRARYAPSRPPTPRRPASNRWLAYSSFAVDALLAAMAITIARD